MKSAHAQATDKDAVGRRILITGATGSTGSATVSALSQSGANIVTASRTGTPPTAHLHRTLDWARPETFPAAVEGIEHLYLLVPPLSADPLTAVVPFIDAARSAGVERLVLLSSSAVQSGDPGLGEVDALIRETFPSWHVLRCSWFMQNVLGDHPLATGIRTRGEIVSATYEGRLPFIDAADIGRTAASLLTAPPGVSNGEYLLTGPEAISYADLATLVSEASGALVRHVNLSIDDYAAHLEAGGYDPAFAKVLASLDTVIASGAQSVVSTTVEDLTGRAPTDYASFLRLHAGELGRSH